MTKLTRTARSGREVLTLTGRDYTVEVEVSVRGLELDAATLEKVLHAPLAMLAERIRGEV